MFNKKNKGTLEDIPELNESSGKREAWICAKSSGPEKEWQERRIEEIIALEKECLDIASKKRARRKELVQKYEAGFWVVFILLFLFSGIMDYNYLPNEDPYGFNIEILQGHTFEADEYGTTGAVADVWRNTRTGETFTAKDFAIHNGEEAIRIALISFLYGLLGCVAFVYCRVLSDSWKLKTAILGAVAVNTLIAGVWYAVV